MKNSVIISTFLLALTSLSACKNDTEEIGYMLPKTRQIELTSTQKELATKNNNFAFKLVQKINDGKNATADKGKSLFVSPFSVTCMLGMINSGTNDECQREITGVLGMNGTTAQQVNEFCYSLISQAPQADKQVTFETVNAVFTNKGYQVTPQYESITNSYYKSKTQSVDFGTSEALATINNWAKESSHGMITDIINDLDPESAVCLLNTAYFEAKWTEQFDKAKTTTDVFTSEDGTKTNVQMMHNKALLSVDANDIFTTVCLPYGSGLNWNMYILLPEKGKNIDDVLACLDANYWESVSKKSQPMVLEVSIPKFSVEDNIDIRKTLTEMGLECIFKKGALSQMLSNAAEATINTMLQKSRIDVSEEGAKMVATTIAYKGDTATPPASGDYQIKDGKFNVNRPFVYLVTESSSNTVFFVGTYTGK